MLYYPNVLLMDLDQPNLWEKLFLKKDTLSKDADHWLASFHEISISHRCSCKCKSNMWLISGTFCADGLLRFYNLHRIPLKKYIWFHYQPKRVALNHLYFKPLLHGRTSVYQEHIECILVFVIRVPEFQKAFSNRSGKRKIWHATTVTIFWDNCSKVLRPSLPEKLNRKHFEKKNLNGEFQVEGPNLAERKNDKNFKKSTLNL